MRWKILKAMIVKEFYQITRDPSSILIAFIMPFMLLWIYMYGVNMDTIKVTMGIKADDNSTEIASLLESFGQSKYVRSVHYQDKETMYHDLVRSKLHSMVIIPNDFITKLDRNEVAQATVLTDGSEVNLSKYSMTYAQSIFQNWLLNSPKYSYRVEKPLITPETRVWYNQDINSHYFILPGSLATTMTILGMLLTGLVLAREWERGTMEGLLATPITKLEILLSKYIPYFCLGLVSMLFSVCCTVLLFDIPFVGNYLMLFAISGLFLFSALGVGVLISTNFKDQFLASQAVMAIGFMPALFLSGLMFPISSMPQIIQYFTYIIPTRYYVSYLLSEFMAGTIWEIVIPNSLFLGTLGSVLFVLAYRKLKVNLD